MKFVIAAALALGSLRAQSTITPAQPKWRDTLQVTYDPSANGAPLRLSDPVYSTATIYFEDDTSRRVSVPMSVSTDNRLHSQLTVPPGACLFEIAFVTSHDYDPKATTLVISRPDGQPARGANDHLMWSHLGDPDPYFEKEIALYPGNFAAYRHRWFLSTEGKEKEIATIRADLEKIGPRPPKPSVSWLYAMTYAHWRLGEPDQTRSTMLEMIHAFPDSSLTEDALNYYTFRSTGDAKQEAQRWERDLATAQPAGSFAGFVLTTLAADPDFPFETVQTIAREQLKLQPADPGPYLAIAKASLLHARAYPESMEGLGTALRVLLEGKYRILFDPAGTLTRNRLADAYRLRSELHLSQGATPDALADVKASESFEKDNNPAGHLLESKIWSVLSDPRHAEAALTPMSHSATFPFDVVSLTGKHWSLSDLKGKTIALNFWFVGCLPCRAEIPQLNPLIDQYQDVVFLGFALDSEDQLRDFLKKFPFAYQIIANSQKIADGYRVSAYPTHILINPAGDIVFETNDDVASFKAALARLVPLFL